MKSFIEFKLNIYLIFGCNICASLKNRGQLREAIRSMRHLFDRKWRKVTWDAWFWGFSELSLWSRVMSFQSIFKRNFTLQFIVEQMSSIFCSLLFCSAKYVFDFFFHCAEETNYNTMFTNSFYQAQQQNI